MQPISLSSRWGRPSCAAAPRRSRCLLSRGGVGHGGNGPLHSVWGNARRRFEGADHDHPANSDACADRAAFAGEIRFRSIAILADPVDPGRGALPGRRLDRRRSAPHRRAAVAGVPPAGLCREQVRRQRHRRHRGRRQEQTGRLHHPRFHRLGGEQSARLSQQHRSLEGPAADHPDLAPADRAGRASLARRQFGRRTDCAGEEAAGPALCHRQRSGFGAAHRRAMVRRDRRHQARARALSRRRTGDQRPDRRSCEDRLARIDAADAALQGRHLAAPRANHEGTRAEPARSADL